MDSLRAIVLGQERDRIRDITQKAEALREQVRRLLAEIEALQHTSQATDRFAHDLQVELERLRQVQADTDALIARINPALSDMMSQTIRESRDEMAEALGPVMGEAIRVQIRDSRSVMIEALYPIIGETVQRAIGEFAREFQRNIDARLKATFGPSGALRSVMARLRGVSPGELALRDAIPFDVQEVFLIQRESGLLMAHSRDGDGDATDSDLISGMLTAIRDFARDSFGRKDDDEQLPELPVSADRRIYVQTGRAAYLAIVATGVEPEGFRARLREFVSELHVQHEKSLRHYNGDPATLPKLQPSLAQLAGEFARQPATRKPMGRNMRLALAGGGVIGILLVGLACFYLRFTLALLPVAFGTATPTLTLAPTQAPPTVAAATATPRPTATATSTFTPTATPTTMPSPSPTTIAVSGVAVGNVWMRPRPDSDAPLTVALPQTTRVTVRAIFDSWAEVEWTSADGVQRGWVPLRWIELNQPAPPALITPAGS